VRGGKTEKSSHTVERKNGRYKYLSLIRGEGGGGETIQKEKLIKINTGKIKKSVSKKNRESRRNPGELNLQQILQSSKGSHAWNKKHQTSYCLRGGKGERHEKCQTAVLIRMANITKMRTKKGKAVLEDNVKGNGGQTREKNACTSMT